MQFEKVKNPMVVSANWSYLTSSAYQSFDNVGVLLNPFNKMFRLKSVSLAFLTDGVSYQSNNQTAIYLVDLQGNPLPKNPPVLSGSLVQSELDLIGLNGGVQSVKIFENPPLCAGIAIKQISVFGNSSTSGINMTFNFSLEFEVEGFEPVISQ